MLAPYYAKSSEIPAERTMPGRIGAKNHNPGHPSIDFSFFTNSLHGLLKITPLEKSIALKGHFLALPIR
jgi:hypothetical protein